MREASVHRETIGNSDLFRANLDERRSKKEEIFSLFQFLIYLVINLADSDYYYYNYYFFFSYMEFLLPKLERQLSYTFMVL